MMLSTNFQKKIIVYIQVNVNLFLKAYISFAPSQ